MRAGLLAPRPRRPPDGCTENSLFRELTTDGRRAGSDAEVPLPAPTLPDGLDAAGQKRRWPSWPTRRIRSRHCSAIRSSRPSSLRSATWPPASRPRAGGSICGSSSMPISTGSPTPTFCGAVSRAETEVRWRRLGAERHGAVGSRSGQRDITPGTDERWFAGSMNLFDRVQLQATLAGEQTRTPESVLVAMRIDPRFDDDRQFPNRWLPLVRDEAGTQKRASRTPITRPADTSRRRDSKSRPAPCWSSITLAFDEPADWFSGANLLRSKLPIVCQDGVRKFRRRLVTP